MEKKDYRSGGDTYIDTDRPCDILRQIEGAAF